jgi:hypothetical protein
LAVAFQWREGNAQKHHSAQRVAHSDEGQEPLARRGRVRLISIKCARSPDGLMARAMAPSSGFDVYSPREIASSAAA